MLYYMLYGLVLFRKDHKNDFHLSKMNFKGGILGGAQNFQGSYLNGTAVPFDYVT